MVILLDLENNVQTLVRKYLRNVHGKEELIKLFEKSLLKALQPTHRFCIANVR